MSGLQNVANLGIEVITFSADYGGEPGMAFDKITDWQVLSGCKNLESLTIGMSGNLDISFLDKMPQLYSFCLYSSEVEENEEQVEADRLKLFSEDSFPNLKCLVIQDKWVRNDE